MTRPLSSFFFFFFSFRVIILMMVNLNIIQALKIAHFHRKEYFLIMVKKMNKSWKTFFFFVACLFCFVHVRKKLHKPKIACSQDSIFQKVSQVGGRWNYCPLGNVYCLIFALQQAYFSLLTAKWKTILCIYLWSWWGMVIRQEIN